jgi:hypothetical protein
MHQASEQASLTHDDKPSNWFYQHEGKSGFDFCNAKLRYQEQAVKPV